MDAHESERPGRGEAIARFLLTRTPLGVVVRRVARLRASVHAKLLGAFLLIALLLVAMTAMSLEAITSVSRHSRLLDQARERVDASRRIEQAVGVQMNVIRNALVLRERPPASTLSTCLAACCGSPPSPPTPMSSTPPCGSWWRWPGSP